MRKKLLISIFLLIFQALLTINVFPQPDHNDIDHKELTLHNESQLRLNHIVLVFGNTSNFDHKLTDFTLGLDYEYRFKAAQGLFGLGIFGKYITTESGEVVAGIPFFVHPLKGLKITTSPIFVFAEENDSHNSYDDHTSEKMKAYCGRRLGLIYNFYLGNLSIGPVVNVYYLNIVALNYGLNIGFDF